MKLKQLVDLFNLSFMTSVFPSVLKTAKLVPVLKKDSKLNYRNYLPISLISRARVEEIYEKFIIKDCIPLSIVMISIIYSLAYSSHIMP